MNGLTLAVPFVLSILLIYWGYKRVIVGVTELQNRREQKFKNEIESLNARLKKIEDKEK